MHRPSQLLRYGILSYITYWCLDAHLTNNPWSYWYWCFCLFVFLCQ